MQELNYLTMLTAVRDCMNTEKLCVGIFTNTQANALAICLELIESMDADEQEAELRAVRNAGNSFVEFKNGSYIKVLSANENARGHAFHKVLYENGIGREVLNCVIRPTEKLRF